MLPLKAVLVSTTVLSMAVLLNFSLPTILDFLTSSLPLFWSFALSWLQPPYLYLLINCIIISIVASSKLQPRGTEENNLTPASEKIAAEVREVAAMIDVSKAEGVGGGEEVVVFGYVESPEVEEGGGEQQHHVVSPLKSEVTGVANGGGGEFVVSKMEVEKERSTVVLECSPIPSAEKPLFSARFNHRRAVKGSPEGGKGVLKVSKPKRRDTLESTWRTMTDGRSMPLTRHLKKSDTFAGASPEKSPVRVVKKSDTFTEAMSSPASGGTRMRREPSLSQDELNRRVEAFIKKFNEEMRLQRQDSLNQYHEMVGTSGTQ